MVCKDSNLYDSWLWGRLENPLVWRSWRSWRSRGGQGLRGLFRRYAGSYLCLALLPVVSVLALVHICHLEAGVGDSPVYQLARQVSLPAVFALPILLWLLSSLSASSSAIVLEREQGTWEPLLATGIRPHELIRGFLQATLGPIWRDMLSATPMLFAMAPLQGSVAGGAALLLTALTATVYLALVGLLASAMQPTRAQARQQAQLWGLPSLGLLVAAPCVVTTLVLGAASILVWRRLARVVAAPSRS